MPNLSGNKGEWSEIYIFLKLMSDGKVYAADKNRRKITKKSCTKRVPSIKQVLPTIKNKFVGATIVSRVTL